MFDSHHYFLLKKQTDIGDHFEFANPKNVHPRFDKYPITYITKSEDFCWNNFS